MSLRRTTPPELLAPAGGHPQLRAAIESGADAVYFGLTRFNARARAANFTPEELPDIMGLLHERGVQGFVTLNTLVYDDELPDVERYVELLARHRVDAIIVQDLGVASLVRQIAPELPLHGSTQMTVTSAESARLVGRLGCERVVLGRELSIREIREIAGVTDLELEVFVHGALCVSYSGQCFSSEAWGGRSANRGQCAQACRLPYDMIVDGVHRSLGDVRYLLSPQDLAGVQQVPALIDAGVACLKIEGRLKGPEYVAATTDVYRRAIDAAWSSGAVDLPPDDAVALGQVFSRGLTPGFLEGPKHQRLVEGRSPGHRGIRVGTVTSVGREVAVSLSGPVKAGDGLVFDAGRPEGDEVGGTVYEVRCDGASVDGELDRGDVSLWFGPKLDTGGVGVGDRVWRTRDPALERRLQRTWEGEVHRRVPVSARVSGREGEPLRLTLTDPSGRSVEATSTQSLAAARRAALDADVLGVAVGRLGATPFELNGLTLDLGDEPVFLAVSALNRVRREAAEALLDLRRSLRVKDVGEPAEAPAVVVSLVDSSRPPRAVAPDREPGLTVLCRSLEQVFAALAVPGVHEIAVDFLEVKGLGEAITSIQAAGRRAVAVSPRVLKPAEERLRAFLLKLGADAILVRSLGLLESLLAERERHVPALYGDFSLNVANRRTLELLLSAGLTRLTPGHDLNSAQLCALAEGPGADRLELILHHHLPIFHTEHCVFARFLSDGDDRSDCGAPCERHEVHLRGADGHDHLVRADMGCRNTVFNAEAQSGVGSLERFEAAGYRRFRIELADHRADEVAPLVSIYQRALAGRIDTREAWRELRETSRFKLTVGSLRVVQEPARPKTPGWTERY